ncbi:MAG: tetratricopeptide repeat protein [Methylococcaceae bacterium]|nr:tetratricopeptide repeat protein [Methylococcaceae bacterium]
MNQSLDEAIELHPSLKFFLKAMQRCNGFGLYFLRCNTLDLRDELLPVIKGALAKPIVELDIDPKNDIYVDAQVSQLMETAPDNAVVFIYGLEKLFYLKERPLMEELNWRRGHYGRVEHPIVFWLPEFLITEILTYAPDFADWYSGVYEFSLSAPEKSNLTLKTWDSVNENIIGSLSLEEKQRWIINLKNLLEELADDNSQSRRDLLNRLGQLYASLGNYDKALSCYQQNLELCRLLKDKENEGATLNNISLIYKARGDSDTALCYLQDSLKICQQIDNKEGEGATLNNISNIYDVQGDYDTALRFLQDSLKITQQAGNKAGEGATLNNISQIYKARGDYDTALQLLEGSLKIYQQIGDTAGLCTTLFNIGHIHLKNEDPEQAEATWREAYQLAKTIGLAQVLNALKNLAKQLGGEDLTFWESEDRRYL